MPHKRKPPTRANSSAAERLWQPRKHADNNPRPSSGLPRKTDAVTPVTDAKHLTTLLGGDWVGARGHAPCPWCGEFCIIRQFNSQVIAIQCTGGCGAQEINWALQIWDIGIEPVRPEEDIPGGRS